MEELLKEKDKEEFEKIGATVGYLNKNNTLNLHKDGKNESIDVTVNRLKEGYSYRYCIEKKGEIIEKEAGKFDKKWRLNRVLLGTIYTKIEKIKE